MYNRRINVSRKVTLLLSTKTNIVDRAYRKTSIFNNNYIEYFCISQTMNRQSLELYCTYHEDEKRLQVRKPSVLSLQTFFCLQENCYKTTKFGNIF